MTMPKDTVTANISRRRLKENRPSLIKYTKRTRGQLAYLEELVEEKKPGSLGGSSFGVFELESTVPESENTIVERGGFANRNQQHSFQFEYAANKFSNIPTVDISISKKAIVNPLPEELDGMVPNISKDSMQSLYNLRPYTDLRVAEPGTTPSNQSTFSDPHQYIPIRQGEIHGLETFESYKTSQHTAPVPPLSPSIQSPSFPMRSRATSHPLKPTISEIEELSPDLVETVDDLLPSRNIPTPESLPETWQLASQSLVHGPKGSRLAELEDVLSEDILVRAIVWGWDSIGERWELPPFWQIIRQLDESMFFLFGPIERMGMFRIVHLLMRYHADPTPERAATIPPFYSKTIDFEGDYYIGNFLPWPGLREVTKSPTHPCRSNRWFQAEVKTLHLLWPSRLQDAYERCPETGLFKLTTDFDSRANNTHCWTFEPDMYKDFPQIYGMAPATQMLPGTVRNYFFGDGRRKSGKSPVQRVIQFGTDGDEAEGIREGKGKRKRKGSESGTMGQDGIKRIIEDYSVDYNNLHWREEERDGQKVMYFTLW